MKIKLLFLVFWVVLTPVLLCNAQEKVKFGKVTPEELQMTHYANDSTASAVVLYEEMDTRYEYDEHTLFKVVNRYFIRIKILTNEGLGQADRSIMRYVANTRMKSETLSDLSGYTYNWVDGNIEKIKLEKQYIFEEKTTEYMARTKFAFQSVKPGSVIEYKYELSSPRSTYLKDYSFQSSIPVKYSVYNLMIPEYYKFSLETKGIQIDNLHTTQSKENQSVSIAGNMHSFVSDTYKFEAENLSGLKNEANVWSVNDFMTRVTFELHSFIVPGVVYETFSNSWATVDEELLNYTNFGKQFNHKLFKAELATLFTPEMKEEDKIRAIYNMVKSKVSRNEKKTLWAENPKEALKKGLGDSGEVNALLISALREAGFEAYPVVMSLRGRGRIPLTHPTIDNLNYFIVAATVEGKPVYMDASSKYGDLNVMAPGCLSDYTRSIRGNALSAWVDLSGISKSMEVTGITAQFNSDGLLSGKVQDSRSNQLAYDFRSEYDSYKDEQEFFEKKATEKNIEISGSSVANLKETDKKVMSSFDFVKKDIALGDNHIYLNPMIFPFYNENPFKAETRILPVEFLYPYDKRVSVIFNIPEGYEVEEIPQSTKMTLLEKNDAFYQYLIDEDKENRRITLSTRLIMNRVIYTQAEYEFLRNFFSELTTKNNEQIVLKKTVQ